MITNLLYGTKPILIHGPGPEFECPLWEPIRRQTFKSKPLAVTCPPEITFITWNSGTRNHLGPPEKKLGWFERSCDYHGLPYLCLGQDIGSRWNNRMKISLTLEALKGITTPYVVGCDSCDVVLAGDPAGLLDRFKQIGAKAVYNGEIRCWPVGGFEQFEDRRHKPPFRYLNGGLWMAETEFCNTIYTKALRLAHLITTWPFSEQICLKHVYRKLYPEMTVDSRCVMFQNLYRATWRMVRLERPADRPVRPDPHREVSLL